MALLESVPGYRRPLLATLAGAGLRIGEALALRWSDVDLATGTLRVLRSKTDAGVRIVDLTPALREELAAHKVDTTWDGPDDYVFATASGRPRNRHNERRAALVPAIEKANAKLRKLGIAPTRERPSTASDGRTRPSAPRSATNRLHVRADRPRRPALHPAGLHLRDEEAPTPDGQSPGGVRPGARMGTNGHKRRLRDPRRSLASQR